MSNEITEIYDTENKVMRLPAFIRKWFLKYYQQQGMVYFESDEPTYVGDMVKWLDELCVRTTSEKRADRLMFEFLNEKYPHYKPYIQLF